MCAGLPQSDGRHSKLLGNGVLAAFAFSLFSRCDERSIDARLKSVYWRLLIFGVVLAVSRVWWTGVCRINPRQILNKHGTLSGLVCDMSVYPSVFGVIGQHRFQRHAPLARRARSSVALAS